MNFGGHRRSVKLGGQLTALLDEGLGLRRNVSEEHLLLPSPIELFVVRAELCLRAPIELSLISWWSSAT